MAGKGNEATERARRLTAALNSMIDKGLEALADLEVAKGDVAAVDRLARCVANLARAGRAVWTLTQDVEEDEAEKGDDDGGSEPDDPEELERLHRELWERVEDVRSAVESRRREGWTISPRQPPASGGDAEAFPTTV